MFFTVESGVGEARGLSWSHPALGRKHRGAHAPWQIKQMIWPPNISNYNGFIKSSKHMCTVLEWRWRERESVFERNQVNGRELLIWVNQTQIDVFTGCVFCLFSFSVETFLTVVIQWDSGVFGYTLVKDQGVTVGRKIGSEHIVTPVLPSVGHRRLQC